MMNGQVEASPLSGLIAQLLAERSQTANVRNLGLTNKRIHGDINLEMSRRLILHRARRIRGICYDIKILNHKGVTKVIGFKDWNAETHLIKSQHAFQMLFQNAHDQHVYVPPPLYSMDGSIVAVENQRPNSFYYTLEALWIESSVPRIEIDFKIPEAALLTNVGSLPLLTDILRILETISTWEFPDSIESEKQNNILRTANTLSHYGILCAENPDCVDLEEVLLHESVDSRMEGAPLSRAATLAVREMETIQGISLKMQSPLQEAATLLRLKNPFMKPPPLPAAPAGGAARRGKKLTGKQVRKGRTKKLTGKQSPKGKGKGKGKRKVLV